MMSRPRLRQFLMLFGICVLLTYQNCAQAPDTDPNSTQSSYEESLPFAYQERVDTIAYMSCSNIKSAVEPRAYFSLRVGAYDPTRGGLALTPEFYSATQYYATPDRARALSTSGLNQNTRLNLAIRRRGDLSQVYSQGGITAGKSIDSLLPQLDGPDVAGPFAGTALRWTASSAGNPPRINYFPGTGEKRLMEGSLRFYEFENVAKDVRASLSSSGTPAYLVVGYSGSADEVDPMLRQPVSGTTTATPASRAYGTGFGFTFAPARKFSNETRTISSINEIDLQTGSARVGASWDCSQDYQFMVIRYEDILANRVTCNRGPDYIVNGQSVALDAIRRVLRPEDWYVDMANKCIVPKNTGDYCYGQLQPTEQVQYGVSNCGTVAGYYCPHFVSICLRR